MEGQDNSTLKKYLLDPEFVKEKPDPRIVEEQSIAARNAINTNAGLRQMYLHDLLPKIFGVIELSDAAERFIERICPDQYIHHVEFSKILATNLFSNAMDGMLGIIRGMRKKPWILVRDHLDSFFEAMQSVPFNEEQRKVIESHRRIGEFRENKHGDMKINVGPYEGIDDTFAKNIVSRITRVSSIVDDDEMLKFVTGVVSDIFKHMYDCLEGIEGDKKNEEIAINAYNKSAAIIMKTIPNIFDDIPLVSTIVWMKVKKGASKQIKKIMSTCSPDRVGTAFEHLRSFVSLAVTFYLDVIIYATNSEKRHICARFMGLMNSINAVGMFLSGSESTDNTICHEFNVLFSFVAGAGKDFFAEFDRDKLGDLVIRTIDHQKNSLKKAGIKPMTAALEGDFSQDDVRNIVEKLISEKQ